VTRPPATKPPATQYSATQHSATAKPATAKPATAKPATAKPATAKPDVTELGIDLAAQRWQRSGEGSGAIEVAFVCGADEADGTAGTGGAAGEWVLMRVAGDPAARVLVFDRNEWECFLDGARNGEFDDAASG
jgi:hypothetical protein